MDVFDSLSSQVGSVTLVKSSSVMVPVAVEGLMKDVFAYPSSSQASSNVLAKPTDNMQINHDQHVSCSPPSPSISSHMSKQKCSALEVPKAPSLSGCQTSLSPSAQSLLPSMSLLSGIHSSSKPFISTSRSDVNSHKKAVQVQGHKLKSSAATSITDEISVPVILQTISSQMTQMNDLFKCTLEDPDVKICDFAVENLRWLETGLSTTECVHFFNLFSTQPALT